jgi:quinoprotein glucose dehydrogenase
MTTRLLSFFGFVLLLPSLSASPDSFRLTPLWTDAAFSRPVSILPVPGDRGRYLLVEQTGKIRILREGSAPDEVPFLDLSARRLAENEFEEGLLGLALHPRFAENHLGYVTYSQQGPKRTVVSEFRCDDAVTRADPASERILLEISQPEWNHNGGNLFFGPRDGYLYLCVGDGGLRNGVHQLAQKLTQWNGKVLRIDVNGTGAGPRGAYAIPADNPFRDTPNACPEIYAYGFRNPWGGWIDPVSGLFWLADVGQDLWEEVDLVRKGGNYGWDYREADTEFAGRAALMDALGMAKKKAPPADAVFEEPVWKYGRDEGISITGGFVYRGSKVPALRDHYIVGDWGRGNIWGLHWNPSAAKIDAVIPIRRTILEQELRPTAFCPDADGEILVLDWNGKIYRLEAAAVAASPVP